jgi:hypothetical protein
VPGPRVFGGMSMPTELILEYLYKTPNEARLTTKPFVSS